MPAELLLKLSANPEQQVEWLRRSSDDDVLLDHAQGSLAEAAKAAVGCQVIVLVPSQEVLLTTVYVPSRQRQHIINAVPYALEDVLAADINEMHFAIGQRDSHDHVNVAVVEAKRMEYWLSLLRESGIEVDVLLPEMLALPYQQQGWSVLQYNDAVLVRSGVQAGFAFEKNNSEDFIPRIMAECKDEPLTDIKLFRVEDESLTLYFPPDVIIDECVLTETPLKLYAEHYDKGNAFNLIQGRFSRREQLGEMLRPWRAAGAMLTAVLMISVGLAVADYWRLSQQRDDLDVQMQQVFFDVLPDAKNVNLADLRSRMASELKSVREDSGGAGFTDLLANIAPLISKVRSAELRHITFRNGQMDLALTISDLQLLEELKQSLVTLSGLQVNIESATSRDNRVEARLRLRSS